MVEKRKSRRTKRRSALPRVTVFAMSKRDLCEFVTAVETLGLLVCDLMDVAEVIKRDQATRRRPGGRRAQPAGDADRRADYRTWNVPTNPVFSSVPSRLLTSLATFTS